MMKYTNNYNVESKNKIKQYIFQWHKGDFWVI